MQAPLLSPKPEAHAVHLPTAPEGQVTQFLSAQADNQRSEATKHSESPPQTASVEVVQAAETKLPKEQVLQATHAAPPALQVDPLEQANEP